MKCKQIKVFLLHWSFAKSKLSPKENVTFNVFLELFFLNLIFKLKLFFIRISSFFSALFLFFVLRIKWLFRDWQKSKVFWGELQAHFYILCLELIYLKNVNRSQQHRYKLKNQWIKYKWENRISSNQIEKSDTKWHLMTLDDTFEVCYTIIGRNVRNSSTFFFKTLYRKHRRSLLGLFFDAKIHEASPNLREVSFYHRVTVNQAT